MDTGDEGICGRRTDRETELCRCLKFGVSAPGWMNSYLIYVLEDRGMKPNRNMLDLGHRRGRKSELEGREGAVVGTLDSPLIPSMVIVGGSGACHGQTASRTQCQCSFAISSLRPKQSKERVIMGPIV